MVTIAAVFSLHMWVTEHHRLVIMPMLVPTAGLLVLVVRLVSLVPIELAIGIA